MISRRLESMGGSIGSVDKGFLLVAMIEMKQFLRFDSPRTWTSL